MCVHLHFSKYYVCHPISYIALPRGGNEAHLAPEVLNVRPGPGKFIDYSKQPVWAAGVLAYELAGHDSPFEGGRIDQRSYETSSLPPLKSTYCQVYIVTYHRYIYTVTDYNCVIFRHQVASNHFQVI